MYICGDYGELHTKRVGFVFFVFCAPPYNTYIYINIYILYVHGTSITSNTSMRGGSEYKTSRFFLFWAGTPVPP